MKKLRMFTPIPSLAAGFSVTPPQIHLHTEVPRPGHFGIVEGGIVMEIQKVLEFWDPRCELEDYHSAKQ